MSKKEISLTHEFVECIPRDIEEGKIYVSIPFATAIHKCCCGCGREVITPLSPTDWKLIFDGKSISLNPSIGNWNFDCQSHYWIKRNKVVWSYRWSKAQIIRNRKWDQSIKKEYYDKDKISISSKEGYKGFSGEKSISSFLSKLKSWSHLK